METEIFNEEIIETDPEVDPETSALAHALIEELKSQASGEDVQDQESEDNEVEQPREIDYSQQISNIYSELVGLRSDIDVLSESVDTLQYTVESTPGDIRSSFDDVTNFQFLVFSLYFGLFIAILFFMGLKK